MYGCFFIFQKGADTQIGNNVFHICQFAELLERNGSYCQAEPEIMGDEAAWQVGRDQYLAIQTCEDGYDYTLFDKEFHEIDGGQLDNPELSMLEARAEILAGFGLQMRELRVQVYEEVMEKAEAVEAVNASLLDLAKQIDQFSDEYDHYEYADRVDDKKSNIVEIYSLLFCIGTNRETPSHKIFSANLTHRRKASVWKMLR